MSKSAAGAECAAAALAAWGAWRPRANRVGIAIQQGHPGRLTYISEFAEEAKASGLAFNVPSTAPASPNSGSPLQPAPTEPSNSRTELSLNCCRVRVVGVVPAIRRAHRRNSPRALSLLTHRRRMPLGRDSSWRRSLWIHSRLCGCEKFEPPNLGAGLHRESLFISAHMSLTTEAHSVVAIYIQPQMAATVITAVVHDSLGRLWKARYHPRWRYGESSTHARSPIQRAPCPYCNRLANVDFLTLRLIGKSG